MLNRWLSLRNQFDYYIRQRLQWQRPGLRLEKEPKLGVFDRLPAAERKKAVEVESGLSIAYDLQDVTERGNIENYKINLYYLHFLETALNQMNCRLPQKIRVADIGCSSWFYVRGFMSLLRGWKSETSREVELCGYEVDAYRPYFNLYSRRDYALAFSQKLNRTSFIPQAFNRQPQSFNLIGQFFPFIFIEDHLEWGLPSELFSPIKLLEDAWISLKPGGVLLVVNQGEKEHQTQQKMFNQIKIKSAVAFKVDSPVYRYDIDHYVLGAVKDE